MASALASQDESSPVSQIPAILERLRSGFAVGRTRPAAFRVEQLRRLRQLLIDKESAIAEALRADLGRAAIETWMVETNFLVREIDHTLKHLGDWLRPERVRTPLPLMPARSEIRAEPYGVVLVLAPWNYPVQLSLGPLLGALSAGNCAVLKPSELAPRTASVIAKSVAEYLDPEAVAVVCGGPEVATALLAERFDYVFYTGSTAIGRIVMSAAAKHLTPVTLELGGKSPCIVDRDVDLEVAARRIAWGKWVNAGQTCVAPDYVLVARQRQDDLIHALRETLDRSYGHDPKASPDYARIVNDRHFARLGKLIAPGNGKVVIGGQSDASDRYLAPTVLTDVPADAPVMQDEIFGPILPVLAVDDVDDAIDFINHRPKPLALYVFSKSKSAQRAVVERTSSGAVAVNETMAHPGVPDLPFGGVGDSGMGAYHGRLSFDTFSHKKAVLTRPTWGDATVRYPPYTPAKVSWLRRILS